jgi:CHAD domain-containing protein
MSLCLPASLPPGRINPAPPQRRLGRRRSVAELRARYEVETAHSDHVTRLALQLFDATHAWLGVPEVDRPILEAAAQLHDVAYALDPVRHLRRGAELVWREGLTGFTTAQCARVVATMLCHSGKWSSQLQHPVFQQIRDPQSCLQLGALLRVADGLDWGHVQDASVVSARRGRGRITVRVASDWFPDNLKRASAKADLWRAVFPLDLRLERVIRGRPRPLCDPDVPTLEAARRLLSVQYKTILANREGAVAGRDPEYLHRLRVALRRLRNLLRVFRKQLPAVQPLEEALRGLGKVLGTARDLDVWVDFLRSEELSVLMQGQQRWPAFVEHFEQLRQLQLPAVRRELRAPGFQRLRRRMAVLVRRELPALLPPARPRPLPVVARKQFRKELRRVHQWAEWRHSPSPEELHQWRGALRRARYVGEFFRAVLGPTARRVTRRLHAVEKPLAQVHDLDVGRAWMEQSGPAAPPVFVDWLRTRREQQYRRIAPAWRRFATLEKKVRHEF